VMICCQWKIINCICISFVFLHSKIFIFLK
jgi:hypothetical protein